MADPRPLLTIVLPTRQERWNAPVLLADLLAAFAPLRADLVPPGPEAGLEILVIDASDDDTTVAIEAGWRELQARGEPERLGLSLIHI